MKLIEHRPVYDVPTGLYRLPRWLAKLFGLREYMDARIVTQIIDLENLKDLYWAMRKAVRAQPKVLLVGYDRYEDFVKLYTPWGANCFGLRIVFVPWMSGAVILTSDVVNQINQKVD